MPQAERAALPSGYEIRELDEAEFRILWRQHAPAIFDDNMPIFRVHDFMSDGEKEKAKSLYNLMGTPYTLNLCLYFNGEFAGWCAGHQESGETFYMRNSAVLPAHRRKGLYTAMMEHAVAVLVEKGFQKIYSRHIATNNDVIIPKLKFGFTISSLELNDSFGILVNLVYFPKEIRRKLVKYRAGEIRADDEVRKALKL